MPADEPQDEKPKPRSGMELPTTDPLIPRDVPVFSCLVYISTDPAGGVRARVANLPGLNCRAANERAAMREMVTAFKKRVAELMESETPIPWIDPPEVAEPDEQQRSIPVHL